MKRKLAALALLSTLLSAGALVALSQDDDGDGHPPIPAHCDNYAQTAPEHRCNCERAMNCPEPDGPKSEDGKQNPGDKCQTYCKPERCACLHPCTTHRNMPGENAYPVAWGM